jgi:hypothetical protein
MGPMVKRILAVSLGFLTAVLAGGVTLFFIGSRWAAGEVAAHMEQGSPDEVSRFLSEALGALAFVFTVAPALTLAPAIVAVLIGELARIRSLLYYLIAGGAAAAAMPLINVAATEATQNSTYAAPYFSIMATAGFAAGLVYWLIAGRRA